MLNNKLKLLKVKNQETRTTSDVTLTCPLKINRKPHCFLIFSRVWKRNIWRHSDLIIVYLEHFQHIIQHVNLITLFITSNRCFPAVGIVWCFEFSIKEIRDSFPKLLLLLLSISKISVLIWKSVSASRNFRSTTYIDHVKFPLLVLANSNQLINFHCPWNSVTSLPSAVFWRF